MRRRWAGCLTLVLAGGVGSTPAQSPSVTLGPPAAALGAPVPAVAAPFPVVRGQMADAGGIVPAWTPLANDPPYDSGVLQTIMPLQVPLPPGATNMAAAASAPTFGVLTSSSSGQIDAPVIYPAGPPSAPIPAQERMPDSYFRERESDRDRGRERTGKHKSYFGEWFQGWGGNGPDGGCLESDHCFDEFASPVSNPFFFEDPRALTEVRPLFFFQTIPDSNFLYKGGHAEFYGLQARLALTERWSIVLNKLGGVSITPGDGSPVQSQTGFAEIWVGPKFTFLRSSETGTIAAAGLTFQIPTGSTKVYQDTGKFSLVPYITGAQNFLRTQYGSFNVMDTLGYSFRTDGDRSDFLFNSIHLDYDVANLHKIYPLIELNWFYYTASGTVRPFGFEGRDLANIGSTGVNNRTNLSLATGLRYKFSECLQAGLAVEFPLNGTRDLLNFRLGVDVIFRY